MSSTHAHRLQQHLMRPVDAAGPAVFRIVFGLLLCFGALRFLVSGWIEDVYARPRFFFHFPGFEWVAPWPAWGMHLHYALLAVCALGIALGLFYRVSALLFFLGFTYLQLIDVTNYLNHYVLVSLLCGLLVVLPLHRTLSLDALRRPALRSATLPAWMLYLLRLQVGVVYVFAGLAKLNPDWLLHAQPLNIWLTARTETPLIGPWLDELWVAYAVSWAGFLYDTTIVAWLSWRRTRPYAYAVLVLFHGLTLVWFNIGMFPFIMTVAALVFFDPAWPRRWLGPAPQEAPRAPARLGLAPWLAAAYAVIQIVVPLRHLAYPGDVLWNEDGMRFAWKVMVREKHGSVTFHVRSRATGKEVQVSPRRYLTAKQEREMGGQPDLILQLAQHIARDFERQGHGPVEVRAEAWVSLNGRRPALMIDPDRDLTAVHHGLAPRDWVLPAPELPPRALQASRW